MPRWLPVLGAFALTTTVAQAEPADPAAAEALFRAGRDAAEHGDEASACARFKESYRLDPATGTLLNIAMCEEALKRLAHAWEHYRRLLDELDTQDPRSEMIRQRLRALEPRVPHLTISLGRGMPAEAEVRRDSLLVTQGGFGIPLPVDPGEHMIAVTAEGREPRTYAVTLNEGQAWNVEVEVGPAKPKTTGDEKPKAVGSRAEANSWRSVGYASIAVGAASAVATGVLAWRYFAAHAELDAECNAQRQCSDSGLRAVGAAGVLRTATIVAASVSVAAIGSGFALLWTHPNSAPPSPAALVPCGIAWTTAL